MGKNKLKTYKKPNYSNKRIGIRFGDSDFYHTFDPVMRIIGEALQENIDLEFESLTKERIVWLVNQLTPAIYILFQNGYSYGLDNTDHTFNYLKISEKDVMFAEEVDACYEKYGGDSGVYVYDLELDMVYWF